MVVAKKAIACEQLLKEYGARRKVYKTERITFDGVNADVYNISAPFVYAGMTIIAGRVEKRDEEISSVRFFKRITDNHYTLCYPDVELNHLQDPCVTFIDGDIVVGGTQIDVSPVDAKQIVGWRTAYLKGKDLQHLSFWQTGPHKMKDVRLLELSGKLLVLVRPQGYASGMGKIGSITLDSPNDFNYVSVEKAFIHNCHFVDGEWGGANEMHILSNGLIGVLGHVACLSSDMDKHYYSMAFCYDPKKNECSPVKIIATRDDFARGEAKRSDLVDVLFTGGLIRNPDGKATLYTGVSDAEAHYAVIDDPFAEYER